MFDRKNYNYTKVLFNIVLIGLMINNSDSNLY